MSTLDKYVVNGVYVSPSTLAEIVHNYASYLRANFDERDLIPPGCDDDSAGGDIRLQVHNGNWRTWEGDSQFDTDHRGAWASAFVPYHCTREQALEIARSLIAECE